jgi:selenocysteine lyase/cysteine desulfurase
VWPLAELASVAHRHGARLFVDAAQLAPHRPLDMAAAGIDFLALSGHKLYAPFGTGALVGDASMLEELPLLQGGGAIRWVTLDDVVWAEAPDRHEAGSPNVLGAVALAAACRRLAELGMDRVAEAERALFDRLLKGLGDIPGLETLTLWPAGSVDRVGVVAFNLDPYRDPLLAAVLSAEHAIGVRHGCFCAQPLIVRLLGIPGARVERIVRDLRAGRRPMLPGAVRASLGIGSTRADVDRLIGALTEIAASGPRARYEHLPDHDEYRPVGALDRFPAPHAVLRVRGARDSQARRDPRHRFRLRYHRAGGA